MFTRRLIAEYLVYFGILCGCLAVFAWAYIRGEDIDVEKRIAHYAPSLPVRRHVGPRFCTTCLQAKKGICAIKHRTVHAESSACRFYQGKTGAA